MTISEFFSHYYDIVCHGDLDQLDTLYHKNSPFLRSVKAQYTAIRQQLEMHIEIRSVELVAKQKDMLIIRDKLHVEGRQGEKVTSNLSDNLHVMTKCTASEWKVHSSACLLTTEA